MLFPILLLSTIFIPTACVPFGKDKGVVLFSCPPEGNCYASPRNCLDDCNAAFSVRSYDNGTVTLDIAMMSPLSYIAVLFKSQDDDKFDTAFICSFHSRYGIVARVNDPPRPVFIMDFVHTTEPVGRTDSIHTRCATNIFMAPLPRDGEYRMTAGNWTSALVIDEDLAIDVAPAVQNARILSTNERVIIPSRKVPVFRASETEGANDMMTSENVPQGSISNTTDALVENNAENAVNGGAVESLKKSREQQSEEEEEEQPRYSPVYGEEYYQESEETDYNGDPKRENEDDDDNKSNDDDNNNNNNSKIDISSGSNGSDGGSVCVTSTLTSLVAALSLFSYNL